MSEQENKIEDLPEQIETPLEIPPIKTKKTITPERLEQLKNARLKANDLLLKLKIANIERWLGLLIALFATSLAGLIYFISKRKRKVQEIQFNDLKEENEEHKTLLATERRNLELEQEIASMKERELTALSLQFYELQESIIEDLKQLEKLEHTPEINRLRKKWARQVKEKNYWQEFELKFTALHPDFLQKLHAGSGGLIGDAPRPPLRMSQTMTDHPGSRSTDGAGLQFPSFGKVGIRGGVASTANPSQEQESRSTRPNLIDHRWSRRWIRSCPCVSGSVHFGLKTLELGRETEVRKPHPVEGAAFLKCGEKRPLRPVVSFCSVKRRLR